MIQNRLFCLSVLSILIFSQAGCSQKSGAIESILISYPMGETALLVQNSGESSLFYGALPQYQKIKQGTFDVDGLYHQLETRLHDNVPREKWPDPKSESGMVNILFQDGTKKAYLIFDEQAFAEQLFSKARENIR
jgi:hypothetical protein